MSGELAELERTIFNILVICANARIAIRTAVKSRRVGRVDIEQLLGEISKITRGTWRSNIRTVSVEAYQHLKAFCRCGIELLGDSNPSAKEAATAWCGNGAQNSIAVEKSSLETIRDRSFIV